MAYFISNGSPVRLPNYSAIPPDLRPHIGRDIPTPGLSAIPPDLRPKKRLRKLPGSSVVVQTPAVNSPAPPADSGFYPYHDYYSGLLSQLGSMRDAALAGLKSALAARTANVGDIVNAARTPLTGDYNNAINSAAAVNDAVANRLAAQGTGATEDLRSKLAALNQDPTAAVTDLAKYYQGLGGANYAMDSGDVQRLIGNKAEALALLDKQPGIIGQQMSQDYSKGVSGILGDYIDKAFGLSQSGIQDRQAYDKAAFDYKTQQAATATDQKNTDIQTYWDNYWKRQDILFRKWQTQIASGDKAAANETKKQLEASKRQAAIDVANIRAGATVTSAQTRAAATKSAAATRAAATKAGKGTAASNINRQRAYTAALNSVIDPKTGVIRAGVNPTGYNADWTMTRIVHSVLKTYGINPATPQGRSILASVMSQANGRSFSSASRYGLDKTYRYHYDPNWKKGAQKAAAKKRPKEAKNH